MPDEIQILRRQVPVFGDMVLQACVFREDRFIPIGPMADTIEELRAMHQQMVAACDVEVIDETEALERKRN